MLCRCMLSLVVLALQPCRTCKPMTSGSTIMQMILCFKVNTCDKHRVQSTLGISGLPQYWVCTTFQSEIC